MKKLISFIIVLLSALNLCAKESVADSALTDKKLLGIARQYHYGIVREADPKKAARIYTMLAQKGNAQAMNELGKMYLSGDGVKRDSKIAFGLFKKASSLGNKNAKCNLALMYQKGQNGVIDFKKAYKLYKQAADSGSVRGMYGAGYLQYKGLGVAQNYEAATNMLEKGAEKNHPGCDFLLASYYANGFGGKVDMEKAEKHYRRASKKGNSWTVDVTKHNLLDSIQKRHERKGKWKHVKENIIPQNRMKKIKETIDANEIEGEWHGKVYTYDWSCKTIIGEQDVIYCVKCNGDMVDMTYSIGDSIIIPFHATKKRGKYMSSFKQSAFDDVPWIITSASFEKNGKYLFANFNSFNLQNMGVRKPMFAVFEKKYSSTLSEKSTFEITKTEVKNNSICITIESDEDKVIDMTLNEMYGSVTKKIGAKKISKGNNKITINTFNINEGIYVVNVLCKDERHSSVITVHNK